MSDPQIRLVVIGVYLMMLVAVGITASLFSRGTKNDYLLASHSIGPILLLLCLFGTTMTGFAMVGSTGESFRKGIGVYGLMASSSGIVHPLCIFLIGIRLFRLSRANGYSTQIQFFQDRLDSKLIGWVLFPILTSLVMCYVLVGVISSGITIQGLTAGAFPEWDWFRSPAPSMNGGVPPWLGTMVVCAVVLFYVFFGGMRGTTWVNAAQTLLFVVFGIVAFFLLAQKLGGQSDFVSNIAMLTGEVDQGLLVRGENFSRSSWLSYLLIPLSLAMFPHLFQHWLTARKAATFRLSIVMHPIFILLVWAPCIFIGIWATTIPSIPPAVKGNPNAVLSWLIASQMGPVVGGILTAGILAAIMSSLDSQILSLGTMFSTDLVGSTRVGRGMGDRQQLMIARAFVLVIVIAVWVLAQYAFEYRQSVFELGVWCFTGFAGMFPLVFAAIYWRRLTAAGALSAILTLAGVWVFLFRASGWGAVSGYNVHLRAFGFSIGLEPVVVIFFATMISMIATSLITKAPDSDRLARFFPGNEPA